MVIGIGTYGKIEHFLAQFYTDMESLNAVTSEFLKYTTKLKVDELKEEITSFVNETAYTDEEKVSYLKRFFSVTFAEGNQMYLPWLKLEGDKMPAINADLDDADYQELGAERGLLNVEIESLHQELRYKQKRLKGVIAELDKRDDTNVNEFCTKCGKPAGFETSPEGDSCGLCTQWICMDCTDASVSQLELVLANGRLVSEDVICKVCSSLLGLHELIPVVIMIKVQTEQELIEYYKAIYEERICVAGYVYTRFHDVRDNGMEVRGVKGLNCTSFKNGYKIIHIYHLNGEVFTVISE
jgi:hypothetical protein